MATILAHVDVVRGRPYPLIPAPLELRARGHRVPVPAVALPGRITRR